MSPPTVTLLSSDNSCHNLFANPLTKTKVSLAENFVCLILRGDADTITFHAWPIMASRMEVDTQTRSSSDAVQIISLRWNQSADSGYEAVKIFSEQMRGQI